MAYGEWLPKLNPQYGGFEDGDVIAYEERDNIVGYRKANSNDKFIIGVVCNGCTAFSHTEPNPFFYDSAGNEIEFKDNQEKTSYGFIPVALNGIVRVKFKGEFVSGGLVCMSDVQGVSRLQTNPDTEVAFGKLLNDISPSEGEEESIRYVDIILLDNSILTKIDNTDQETEALIAENKELKEQVSELNDALLEVMFGSEEESFDEL